ncbi:CCA tRNA nucleotidyltransferase 1, mitochondrial-like [Babylonia areolata]|uniref:CCA tRNA nucleotidyltransferase 1, mitochondrial-like n=1 Tax=Babylonia areolata TaxID=304850 RepID=UPI003FD108E5
MKSFKTLGSVLQWTFHNRSSLVFHAQFKRLYTTWQGGRLFTMKVDTPEFHQLFTPELNQLKSLFDKYGFELRIAGGAVRDLMMEKVPHDVDFATTATPTQMKEMFEKEQIRMINNKGEKHGTITARINDKENFEVTTLRIDVRTDGRHAEVEFTKDWQLDANRRDLTINAMFLDFDGTLIDYFNGKDDLDARRVRFVGSAEERIREDYLRILRYFRFFGRIAKDPDSYEQDVLDAIRSNVDGLAGIAGERLWTEVKKIVCGRFNGSIMQTMLALGIGPHIGLTGQVNKEEYLRVCEASTKLNPLPITFMTALLCSEDEVYTLNKRLKMSNEEVKTALFILQHRNDPRPSPPLRYCMDLHNDTVAKEKKIKDRIMELLRYQGESSLLEEFQAWTPPRFPITGYDLFAHKVPKGPVFAKTLNDLRQLWKESSYQMSKEELVDCIEEVVKRHT